MNGSIEPLTSSPLFSPSPYLAPQLRQQEFLETDTPPKHSVAWAVGGTRPTSRSTICSSIASSAARQERFQCHRTRGAELGLIAVTITAVIPRY
jgi:hypothetical protein